MSCAIAHSPEELLLNEYLFLNGKEKQWPHLELIAMTVGYP